MQATILNAKDIDHPYYVEGITTISEARRYCEKLAKSHYENFLVAGIFCPKPLRQHFYNVYAYCRISDDLSDEIGDAQKSLVLLDWWEEEVHLMYSGKPKHPAFVALEETVQKFQIPPDPFLDCLRLASTFREWKRGRGSVACDPTIYRDR